MDTLTPQALNALEHKYSLPRGLLAAVIKRESSGDVNAMRFEPRYRYLWDVVRARPFRSLTSSEINSETPATGFSSKTGSYATEWVGQATSWGPMQVMGAVAREYGFTGFFPELCGELGAEYGARHLKRLADRFLARHGWDGVIAAYNAGSPRRSATGRYVNQSYVDGVKRYWGK